MAWPKGKPRPIGSGRRAGTPNKRSLGIEPLARSIVTDPAYQERLRARALAGTLAPGMETMLFTYAFGKPRDRAVEDIEFAAELVEIFRKYADSMPDEVLQAVAAMAQGFVDGPPRLRVVQ